MSAPGSDFRSFVGSLSTGAASALAEVEKLRSGQGHTDQEEGQPSSQEARQQADAALAVARQLIDTLVMLEEKTKGNLTPEETEALRSSLTSLRISFVRVSTPTN
jgi:GH24 family phage-related lysozyme (muramidase)